MLSLFDKSSNEIEYEVDDVADHQEQNPAKLLWQTSIPNASTTPAAMAALALAVTQQEWSELGLVGSAAVTAATSTEEGTETADVTTEAAAAATTVPDAISASPRDLSGAVERITALLLMRIVALVNARQTQGCATKKLGDLSTTGICHAILQQPKKQKRWKKPITALLISQLRNFTRRILERYQAVHYHNWEHAYHVVISAHKLLDMMLSLNQHIHCRTFGLKRDPLAQLALVFSALVHDVEHQGITNQQLVLESDPLAMQYNDQSVLENCSVNVAFVELQSPSYSELRQLLFPKNTADEDYRRFRKIVINLVLTTDIASPERTQLSKSKWKEAFGETLESLERKRSKLLRTASGNRFMMSSPRFSGGNKSPSSSNNSATLSSMTHQQRQLQTNLSGESSISPESVFQSNINDNNDSVNNVSGNKLSLGSRHQRGSGSGGGTSFAHHQSLVSQISELTLDSTVAKQYRLQMQQQQQQQQQQLGPPPPPPLPHQNSSTSSLWDSVATPTAPSMPNLHGEGDEEDNSSTSSSVTPESSYCRGETGDGGRSTIREEDDDDDDDSMDGVIQTGTTLSLQQHMPTDQQQPKQQRKASLDQDTQHTKNARLLMEYDSTHKNRFSFTETTTTASSHRAGSTGGAPSNTPGRRYLRYQEALNNKSEPTISLQHPTNRKPRRSSSGSFSSAGSGSFHDDESANSNQEGEAGKVSQRGSSHGVGGAKSREGSQESWKTTNVLTPSASDSSHPTRMQREESPIRKHEISTDAPVSPRRVSMNDLSHYLGKHQQQQLRRAYHGSYDQDEDYYDGFAGEEDESQTPSETLRKPILRECRSTSGASISRRIGASGEHYDSTDSNEKEDDDVPMTSLSRRYSSSDAFFANNPNGSNNHKRRVRKRAMRLSIRRSMDLSGQTIEHFSSAHSRSGSFEQHHGNSPSNLHGGMYGIQEDINWDPDDEPDELRATVVLELFLKAADVAHNLQGWTTLEKWSSRLFMEVKSAFENGRGYDPEPGWYENQIGFLESYLIPMARRLHDTGVFGTQIGPIFEQIVMFNLERWITDGMEVTEAVIRKWQEQKWELEQQQKNITTTLDSYHYFDD